MGIEQVGQYCPVSWKMMRNAMQADHFCMNLAFHAPGLLLVKNHSGNGTRQDWLIMACISPVRTIFSVNQGNY
ncbi:hypothetical protein ACOZ4Y_05740 [Komagataeibacter rhaeticus]|uniref:hypothetical protein n=1 Tax=Komagataeibacter rhaeticus TaxID=215221 RepID=UPI001111B30D|nr:hypothetical protein [Komagataeibacter rhaeticus]MBL7240029.1 hypothetical protein [Komagataeibacter rhaeticus]MDT8872915.1 hypothetical protein [Komagataeibacter rhaeticus]WPP23207.1 hypothetical protein SCD25_06975 [Komagataeibacter rhaeticus]